MALGTAAAMAWPFIRDRDGPASRAAHEVESFRSQLSEVETDLARGVLTQAEAEAARIELSRRLLTAAEAAEVEAGARPAPSWQKVVFGALAAIGVPAATLGVYLQVGTPTLPDRPLAERDFMAERLGVRPSQQDAETEFALNAPPPEDSENRRRMEQLVEQVRARLTASPDDVRGWDILARSLASMGEHSESWRAYQKVVEIDTEAGTAELYANMTESMFMAAGGYVSPEAEVVVDKALALEPGLHQALFFKSLALAQQGDMRSAIEGWAKMLRTAPEGAPWIAQVQDNIRNASAEIGMEPPEDLVPRGPTAEQRAAAADMDEDDRKAMIAGMVEGLAAELAEDPDDLRGWMMLIRSYTILGQADDARAAQKTALEAFEGDEDATKQLEAAF